MELTEREHRVVTNIWGDDTPDDLREIDTEQLWAMHELFVGELLIPASERSDTHDESEVKGCGPWLSGFESS